MPAIRRSHARQTQRFGERHDRSIDETEIEIVEPPVQLRHTRIRVLGQICYQIVAFGDPRIDDYLRLCQILSNGVTGRRFDRRDLGIA
jgi:hypothetical protein